jgi:hypothetical protein
MHKHRMKDYPIHIDDSASPDIRGVSATLRRKRKFNIKHYYRLFAIVIRYKSQARIWKSPYIKKIKRITETEIPIIVLSQLSQLVETRGSSKDPCYLIYVRVGRLSKMLT